MPRFQVAHVKEQGVKLIIILVDSSFGRQNPSERRMVLTTLQQRATNAGLAGTVVLVWDENGTLKAFAPKKWHSFFETITPEWIEANINRELYW